MESVLILGPCRHFMAPAGAASRWREEEGLLHWLGWELRGLQGAHSGLLSF